MTVSMHRVLASLHLPTNASALVIRANAIVEAVKKSPWLPAPLPSLAEVQAAADALQKADVATHSRTIGLVALRDQARKRLVDRLLRLKAYVQAVANDTPEHAVQIIESAAMTVVGRPPAEKPALAVYRGRVSGSVRLAARAIAKETSYRWQRSDDGGKTWIDSPLTLQSKTTVSGLQPGTRYGFRFQAVTRRFTTNWCDPVFYVVQ